MRTAPNRDYPNKARLDKNLEVEVRRILDAHYELVDAHAKTLAQVQDLQAQVAQQNSQPPRGTGATDSRILGLKIAPADLQALANGATLKYDKPNGRFIFS